MSIAAHIVGTRLVGPRQTVAVVTQSASDLAHLCSSHSQLIARLYFARLRSLVLSGQAIQV